MQDEPQREGTRGGGPRRTDHLAGHGAHLRIAHPQARQGGRRGTDREIHIEKVATVGEAQQGGIVSGGAAHAGAVDPEGDIHRALGTDHLGDGGAHREGCGGSIGIDAGERDGSCDGGLARGCGGGSRGSHTDGHGISRAIAKAHGDRRAGAAEVEAVGV